MPPLLLLLANGDLNTLTGSSGWARAGLLGLVMAWLLWVHLPAKDRQMAERDARVRELVNDHQQHVALVTKTFTDNLAIQRQEFTKSLEVQRHSYAAMVERVGGHCKDELAQVTEAYRREHDRIIEAHDQFYALLDNRFARSKGKAGEGVP